MKNLLKIGLIVADDLEYEDLIKLLGSELIERKYYNHMGHTFSLKQNEREIAIWAVHCGIGTVNAATAAMFLVSKGVDILLNYGLSGGISGVSRGEDIISSSFMEYDFDLTCCGYKMCEKPSQKYIYQANENLVSALKKANPSLKSGKMASGDKFVSDPILKEKLKNEFNINCCDMETSAIASVADLTGVPFAALRRVSDDAGEDATSAYREMNTAVQSSLPEKLINAINQLFSDNSFWI